jgi:hypothetical protein
MPEPPDRNAANCPDLTARARPKARPSMRAEPPLLNQLSAKSAFTTAGQCAAVDQSCCGQSACPLVLRVLRNRNTLRGAALHSIPAVARMPHAAQLERREGGHR